MITTITTNTVFALFSLRACFQEPDTMYVVMEYLAGGDLLDRILNKIAAGGTLMYFSTFCNSVVSTKIVFFQGLYFRIRLFRHCIFSTLYFFDVVCF